MSDVLSGIDSSWIVPEENFPWLQTSFCYRRSNSHLYNSASTSRWYDLPSAWVLLLSKHPGTPRRGTGTPGRGTGTPGRGTGTPGRGTGTPGRGTGTPGRGTGTPGRGTGTTAWVTCLDQEVLAYA
jgi:hypothetical protein